MRKVSQTAQMVGRRDFIKTGALGVASLALGSRGVFAIGKERKPPNIWWIMSDEHNPHVTGAYGNKIVRTPHMDGGQVLFAGERLEQLVRVAERRYPFAAADIECGGL